MFQEKPSGTNESMKAAWVVVPGSQRKSRNFILRFKTTAPYIGQHLLNSLFGILSASANLSTNTAIPTSRFRLLKLRRDLSNASSEQTRYSFLPLRIIADVEKQYLCQPRVNFGNNWRRIRRIQNTGTRAKPFRREAQYTRTVVQGILGIRLFEAILVIYCVHEVSTP